MTTGILVSPKTLTSSTLHPSVIKSFAYPLPKKYEDTLHLFVNMEKVVSIAYRREMRITFANVSKNVEKNTKMSFNESHLSQILAVFPKSYELRWEKHRQPIGKPQAGTDFDLVMKPNVKTDLENYLISSEPTKRMDGWRLTSRKMLFRHFLVLRVKKVHKDFLQTNNVSLPIGQLVHPDFDLESVADLTLAELPRISRSDTPVKTIRDYLEKMEIKDENVTPKAPVNEKSPMIKQIKQSPKTPKESLLDRVRARESARKLAKSQIDPKASKRVVILQLLKQSMVEVICSHYGLMKVSGMNVQQLMPLVALSCGKMDKKKFLEHIDVMCAVAPEICSKETFLGTTCLKLSEARADKILEYIDRELNKKDSVPVTENGHAC